MCGITGIVTREANRYRANLTQMMMALRHRGPDGEGAYFYNNCALAHTRLSIIDPESGQQPMLSANGNKAIVFNGEIYGYKPLRSSLVEYTFQTTSDTEVILALYERHGCELLPHLPGMFSFAIWDNESQELFCARDRFGEKPFYYSLTADGTFLFASEIKALLATGLVQPKLNFESLRHYLQHLYVHPTQCIYSNVFVLPPGHCLRYNLKGKLTVERYWNLPETRSQISMEEAIEQFKCYFKQAVAKQLVADVPVGAFLSGGLDSSTIVSVAAQLSDRIKTFSFGFTGSSDETYYASTVAQQYQTEHIELRDGQADIADLLIKMQDIYDEPFADSSNIPTYLISKMAREYVKVALTGDGGDELLAGYNFWYQPLFHMSRKCNKMPGITYLFRLARKLSHMSGLGSRDSWNNRLTGTFLNKQYQTISSAHHSQNKYFSDDELVEFGLSKNEIGFPLTESSTTNTLDDALRADLTDYMPGDILVKIDRASMANGLELRAPFLDAEFASFCISLPYQLKINSHREKLILRRAYESAWPAIIRKRPKLGFGAPIGKWLSRDSMQALKSEYLGNPCKKLFSLLPYDQVKKFAGRDNYQTWSLLVLALWMERH